MLDGLDKLSCNGLVPDLTLLLDVDSNVGLARTIERGGSESRFEAKGEAFHQKVRQGFLARASKEPNRIVIIDAAKPPLTMWREASFPPLRIYWRHMALK